MMPRQWVVRVSTLLAFASSLTSLKGQTIDALTVRLIACADSAHKLMNTNHNSEAFTLLNTALHGPLRHKSKLGTSYLLYELALLERKQGHLDKSLRLLKQVDTLVTQTHNSKLSCRISYAMSVGYADLGDYSRAISQLHQTVRSNRKGNDRYWTVASYMLLGDIHKRMGNKELYLSYERQAGLLIDRTNDRRVRMTYYMSLAEFMDGEKKYKDALFYIVKAIETIPRDFKEENANFLMFSYLIMAHAYQGLGDLPAAKEAVAQATQWGKYHRSFDTKSILYVRMASIQAAQRHYHQAALLGEEAVTLARSSQRPDLVLTALDSLQHFQFLDGQHQAAWLMAQTVRQLSDSLASVAKTKAVADLDTRYKVAAKEATIQELRNEATIQKLLGEVRQRALEEANQQQTRLLWIAFSLTFGMVGIGFMLWRSQQLQQETEAQRQLLESQATELQELSHYKDKLFSMVSHDLRVPVIALKRLVTEGKQTYPTVDEWHTLRATLTTHIEQFYTLVNNVLYWSLGQRGQIRLKVHLFFLDELIADSIETLSAEINQKRLVLVNHVAHEPLVADENTTGLVLRNLLHNAIKFTPVGGTITLRSLRNDDELALMIRDTGPGLTATRHQRNSKLTSTGLGLAVSEELMTLSGGKLHIDEVEPQGTEVVLSWPLAE
jgi:signal transduction histidine kinase